MDINQLIERLSRGPLSNLALANNGDGTIVEAKIPAIVGFTNEGLLRLHSRFILAEKEVILEQNEAITRYTISSKNAVSNLDTDPDNPAFIKDSEAEPYGDDLIKILSVYDHHGCEVPLNVQNDSRSVYTPSFNILQVPVPIQGHPLYILYQAKHDRLVPENLDAEISIPEVLEEALLAFVSYKVFDPMNGQEHTAKAQEHLDRFEMICSEMVDRDLVNSSISDSLPKFEQRGFV